MLVIEQTLTCDICCNEIRHLRQSVLDGHQIQRIDQGPCGVRGWKDVCSECFGHLVKAFWEVKKNAVPGDPE